MSTLSFMISSILEYFRIKRYIQDVVSKEAMAMKREAVEEFVSSVVEGIIAGTDMELVDVDYVRERDWDLRVYLDKPGGVDLDDCQLVSEKLSAVLDEKDPITENYLLEVSSPGLDRVLKKDKDLVRYNGRDVDIQLFKPVNGSKQFTGALQGFTDTSIDFTINGESITFKRNKNEHYFIRIPKDKFYEKLNSDSID